LNNVINCVTTENKQNFFSTKDTVPSTTFTRTKVTDLACTNAEVYSTWQILSTNGDSQMLEWRNLTVTITNRTFY